MTTTLYDCLGVSKTASQDELHSAYRRLARKLHPDTSGASSAAMVGLNTAWSVLGDVERRQSYDASLPQLTRRAAPTFPRSRKQQWLAGVAEQIRRLGVEAGHSAAMALAVRKGGDARTSYLALLDSILAELTSDTGERVKAARRAGAAPLDLGLAATLVGVRVVAGQCTTLAEAQIVDRMWDTLAHGLSHEVEVALGGNPRVASILARS